ncbi:hypothetical protein BHE74_00045063 [Ensete ventricosum]|uniref:Uncharacterized protein n=1 Tax=Ensete ventricosum TaxID=4639 RepID=A0A426ZG89_ENSVE|nr:hypothetical protein B296_00043055 [Ensete ventricosum]RWV89751.1 hypothetical protein GW17_00048088 [Ensete ventricosum]RWW48826.1 hypothetical protein BHE74_00045063 [Ensete ventricosum]RZS19192.1 hypothetical protein BHM03_00051552 [Ensete ventricosum]
MKCEQRLFFSLQVVDGDKAGKAPETQACHSISQDGQRDLSAYRTTALAGGDETPVDVEESILITGYVCDLQ